MPIRVAILGEDGLAREGLRRMVASDPVYVLVGEGASAALRTWLQAHPADILVADARAEGVWEFCRALRQAGDRPALILLAPDGGADWVVRALEAGARGVLGPAVRVEELLKAIRVVHEGQIWASRAVLAWIVEELAGLWGVVHGEQARLAHRLSRREHEVVRHVVAGLSNQEIAARLGVAEKTIKAHLTQIFRKVGVTNRLQLAVRLARAEQGGAAPPEL